MLSFDGFILSGTDMEWLTILGTIYETIVKDQEGSQDARRVYPEFCVNVLHGAK